MGIRRFLERVWRLRFPEGDGGGSSLRQDTDDELERLLHKTIQKVTDDIEKLQMNTAISAMMIFVNEATKRKGVTQDMMDIIVRLLSVFAPHIGEELWRSLGNDFSIAHAPWPDYDPDKTLDEEIKIPVQVNGKLRGLVHVQSGANEGAVRELAMRDDNITRHLEGAEIRKVIYVPDKLLNFVVSKK